VGSIELLLSNTATLRLCDQKIFGTDCRVFPNVLTLAFAQGDPNSVSAPNMGAYLTTLGLNTLTLLPGTLNIFNVGTRPSAALPFPAVTFLPSLRRVQNLVIRDVNPGTGVAPLFTSLPGLANLDLVVFITTSTLGFTDMSSFRGLKCVPGTISSINNARLTSLTGFGNIDTINYGGAAPPTFQLTGSPSLTTPASINALGKAAGCPGFGGSPPPNPTISLQVLGCGAQRVLTTWAAYCTYITTGACP
jgi:hypothetical protein